MTGSVPGALAGQGREVLGETPLMQTSGKIIMQRGARP